MIVVAVRSTRSYASSRDSLRTHLRYVHLVTWPNLSMLASTTGHDMFEKQDDSYYCRRSCQGTFKPTFSNASQHRPVLLGTQLDQLLEKEPQRRQVRKQGLERAAVHHQDVDSGHGADRR